MTEKQDRQLPQCRDHATYLADVPANGPMKQGLSANGSVRRREVSKLWILGIGQALFTAAGRISHPVRSIATPTNSLLIIAAQVFVDMRSWTERVLWV